MNCYSEDYLKRNFKSLEFIVLYGHYGILRKLDVIFVLNNQYKNNFGYKKLTKEKVK